MKQIIQQYGSHMVYEEGKMGGSTNTKKLYVNFDTRFSNDIGCGSGGGSGTTSFNFPQNTPNATMSNATSASFNFVPPVRLTNIQSMSVTNVELPISYYNISTTLGNNTFRITNVVSGNAWTISLPNGHYNTSEFKNIINSSLPSGVTFSVNSQGQSVFTNMDISGSPLYVEFYTDTLGGYDKNNPKFKLGWIMGFRYIAYPIAYGASLIAYLIVEVL